MGQYSIELTGTSRKDLQRIHRSGHKSLIKKVEIMFLELNEHPYTGTGKPEQLKYYSNIWSRRLDKKNRLLYTVDENVVRVYVISLYGHYDDK